jgi:hypothetical protein
VATPPCPPAAAAPRTRAFLAASSTALLAALLAWPAARLVAAAAPAEVTALEGTAARTRGSGQRAALAEGAQVGEGDLIETGEASRLELRFTDHSVLRLGPTARLQLTAAHFSGGPSRRKLSARLFFGNLWAQVTSVISGDQKFQVETENAVAGVRGTTFRVDARPDKSVLVRVYAGAVAVAKKAPLYQTSKPGEERREVQGPEEVSRERWEKLVGRQMQIVVAADGTPGEPTRFDAAAEKDDDWARWNQQRDAAPKR